MPILPKIDFFKLKDLFIDVKLEAIVNGTSYDFTGKKIFSASFYKQNMGFGITSVNVEINTSLQPIIDIDFKDLYGNTVFGAQRSGLNIDKTFDYSVLFNWPPPKFIFSFKGYLGRRVNWILNLKKTTINYNSADGSYDIKCSFVPNQWGFLADIPFLYLLAVKRLKKNKRGATTDTGDNVNEKDITIFDLIKIGRKVDIVTTETSKEFDGLLKKIGSIKSDIANNIVNNKVISFDTPITGDVGDITISGFQNIVIPRPKLDGTNPTTDEQIKALTNDTVKLNDLNTYLLLSTTVGGTTSDTSELTNLGVQNVKYGDLGATFFSDPKVNEAKGRVLEKINDNLDLVDKAVKAKTFKSSKTQLKKITISKIFSKLVGDSAYILGRILESGIRGYKENQVIRDSLKLDLIGNNFPLVINSNGEEVPATTKNISDKLTSSPVSTAAISPTQAQATVKGVGVEENEMAFVRELIQAVTEGIANNLLADDANQAIEDNKIKSRINNLEILKNNPYKPFYQSIASNILIRSGIVGFLTRSNDPNKPGDYGKHGIFTGNIDNDSVDSIILLVDLDSNNITDNILSQLSNEDNLLLKRFCTFFTKFFSEDGKYLLDAKGASSFSVPTQNSSTTSISDLIVPVNFASTTSLSVYDYRVVMDAAGNTPTTQADVLKLESQQISGFKTLTLRQVINPFFRPPANSKAGIGPNAEDEQLGINDESAFTFVDSDTLTADRMINNGVAYLYPNNNSNKFYVVMFQGDDALNLGNKNSAKTDSEFSSEDKDERDPYQSEPLGIINLDAYLDDKGKVLGRIETINEYIYDGQVLDYNKLKTLPIDFYRNPNFNELLWTSPIGDPNKLEDDTVGGIHVMQVPPSKLAFTVYAHQDSGSLGNNLVFGPFIDGNKGRNQRVYIRKICSDILTRLINLDDKKNQVIGNILGKATDQENLIYKQLHTIYHQWETIASKTLKTDDTINKTVATSSPIENNDLATILEKDYGGSDNHALKTGKGGNTEVEKLGSTGSSSVFVYDYPAQNLITNNNNIVDVRNAIINIEPLYKPNANTTVLNIIQQICTKNNFIFVPIPGDANYNNIAEIFKPSTSLTADSGIKNFFHVLFVPTPESRSKLSNGREERLTDFKKQQEDFKTDAFEIDFGSVDNQIVRSVSVGTEDTKPTAESIVNLQRLVDNENQNKVVTTDCSTLSVLEGRSYKASCDMIGNAQIYPMQYFFLRNFPLFGGLYQVMKVKHSIKPNDMTTTIEGIRMRFSPGAGYGGVQPITTDSLENLQNIIQPNLKPFDVTTFFPNFIADSLGTNNPLDTGTNTLLSSGGLESNQATEAEINKVILAMRLKNYVVYQDGKLNLVSIRSYPLNPDDSFNDIFYVFWFNKSDLIGLKYKCTTKPGRTSLLKGSRIVAEGQYVDNWVIGKHNSSLQEHKALRQLNYVDVYDDITKDGSLHLINFKSKSAQRADKDSIGGFQIHTIWAKAGPTQSKVNGWSAGCTVFPNRKEHEQFMEICDKSAVQNNQKTFTYTILKSTEIV